LFKLRKLNMLHVIPMKRNCARAIRYSRYIVFSNCSERSSYLKYMLLFTLFKGYVIVYVI